MKSAVLATNHKNESETVILANEPGPSGCYQLATIGDEPNRALPVEIDPALGYLASFTSDDSRRVQLQALATVARLLRHDLTDSDHQTAIAGIAWHRLNNSVVKAIATRLATAKTARGETVSPATANRKLDAVRAVLRQAWLNGLMTRDEYERAVDVGRIKGERELRGRSVSSGEMLAVFQSCRNDEKSPIVGKRDAAMIALLFGAGLRRAEAAALTVADLDLERCEILVKRGKGNKSRRIPLPAGTVDAVKAWLESRGSYGPDDALLCPLARGGKIEARTMSTQAIWKAIQSRARKAGIKLFAPHDCRRTFIGDLLDTGADLSTAQKLAGHSKPDTTAKYDRRGDEVRRAAINKLRIPFV